MQQLAAHLSENADAIAKDIMQDWNKLGEEQPWRRVPQYLDQDHLPAMIRSLADTALAGFFDLDARRRAVHVAAQHGEHRFEQGASEEILSREYELLRWSLWRRLKSQAASERASQAIIRIDSALTLAHGASLRGYHRAHIERSGDWPAALERYVQEWSFVR
jgi:hypothetical protein